MDNNTTQQEYIEIEIFCWDHNRQTVTIPAKRKQVKAWLQSQGIKEDYQGSSRSRGSAPAIAYRFPRFSPAWVQFAEAFSKDRNYLESTVRKSDGSAVPGFADTSKYMDLTDAWQVAALCEFMELAETWKVNGWGYLTVERACQVMNHKIGNCAKEFFEKLAKSSATTRDAYMPVVAYLMATASVEERSDLMALYLSN